MTRTHALAGGAMALALLVCPTADAENPVEVGTVAWPRDFDAALAASERTGKPVFAFFQEVPGCQGCRTFGREVMSHPAIVQAVQDEFVPVLVYNNRDGRDAELLKRFDEPAWNYQVIRFLDGRAKDVIPRKDRVWTVDALAHRMVTALRKTGRTVPGYLEVAAYEKDTKRHATAAFAQHCFWTGEYELGRVPGVITTEAGWLDGHEVTLVRYHADLVSLESLIDHAAKADVARTVYLGSAAERERASKHGRVKVGTLDASYRRAKAGDQKKQIQRSPLAQLELTPMQRTKVNAFAPRSMEHALRWLTADQRRALADRRERAAEP